MIESIFSPRVLEGRPWKAFVCGFVFTFVAILLAGNVGSPSPEGHGVGFLVVAFISVAAAPFFVHVFRIEEKRKSGNIFQRHSKVIRIYAWFFLSVIIASSLFYVMMPGASAALFSDQLNDLESKGIISVSGHAVKDFSFTEIAVNNLKVLALAIVFSFMLGAGAVFLISWNATIIGVLIGRIAEAPASFGAFNAGNIVFNYLVALPVTLLTLLPHGIFEIGGYFLGAIAGGILSVALIQERYQSWKDYRPILFDVLVYACIAVVMVVAGAGIEVVL